MIKRILFSISCLLVYINSSQIGERLDRISPAIFSVNESNSNGPDSDLVVHNVTQFVVRVKGGRQKARHIADKYHLKLVKKVFKNSNYFLFQQEVDHTVKDDNVENYSEGFRSKMKRGLVDRSEVELLELDPRVQWVQEQMPKKRVKRDFIDFEPSVFTQFQHKRNFQEHKDKNKEGIKFNDPMWSKLWYINSEEESANTMRIKEAWELGYTGKGVVVTILDDGLEWDHPDIIKNYDPRASLDINDSDNDPRPRYDRYNYNKHGTRCAGEIAAMADNRVCSVGVAYNSKIGGIRMLDGEVTDLVEATALSYNRDYIDIYSASWGPDDDGKTVDGPGFLALKAIEDGIRYGRRGLGSIYVWASGNGGKDDDNCNCDGYTNSIYTISISSATQNGNIPWYSEACSSTLASTFSSGSYEERQIITTDLRKSCTEAHTGTSASAPLAAGIIALTLEANPELSWRDIQHIIVETSKPDNLTSTDWQLNGANRKVSHSFGYGMMDALAMVQMAKKWINVPNQRKCVIESSPNGHHQKPILIPKGDRLVIELYSSGCKGTNNEINYLEHVQAVITVQSNSRGTLVVYLKSPMGTNSTLLDRRMLDQSAESFNKWPFTSVHMWGEEAQGTWTIEIKNNAKNTTYLNLNLILYGTKDSPQKRSADNVPKVDLVENEETSQQALVEKVVNQDHKNRKPHGTNEIKQNAKKLNQWESFRTSQTTKTMATEQNFFFKNKLFQNGIFDQNYDDSANTNKDYINELFKENNFYDHYANDEEYLDDSYEYKFTNGHLYRDGKEMPDSERSSIFEFKYSSKIVDKSMAARLEFNFYTQLFFAFIILIFSEYIF